MKFVLIVTILPPSGIRYNGEITCHSMEEVRAVGQTIYHEGKNGKVVALKEPWVTNETQLTCDWKMDFSSYMEFLYNS